MTDGGGIFYSNLAIQLYDMLGIRKERIDPGEPWQNYAETLFSIQRRLADHAFSNARTWPEIQQAHQTWWTNYNTEHHYAHRERQDGRHSPRTCCVGCWDAPIRKRCSRGSVCHALYPPSDRHGYVRFKNWQFFGEDGLAGEQVSVWVYEGTLKIEYQTTALSLYSVRLSPDHQITEVINPRRMETRLRSPQLDLWQLFRDGVVARITPSRPSSTEEAGQDHHAGTAAPASRDWCDWMKAFLCCSSPRREVRTPASQHGTACLSKTSRSCENVMPSPRKPLSSTRS